MKQSIMSIKEVLAEQVLLASGAVALISQVKKPIGSAPEYNVQLECVDPRVAALFANALRMWDAVDRIEIYLDGKTYRNCDDGVPWREDLPTIAEQNPQRVAFHVTCKTSQLAPWARSQRSTDGVPGVGVLDRAPSGAFVIDAPSWTGVELYKTKINVISGEVTRNGLPLIVSWNTVKSIAKAGVAWKEGGDWKFAAVAPWPLGVTQALWQSRDTTGVAWQAVPFTHDGPSLPMTTAYLAASLFAGVKRGDPGSRPFELGLMNLWVPPLTSSSNPGRWGVNRYISSLAGEANTWKVAPDTEKRPYNSGGFDSRLPPTAFDWASGLCLMGTKAMQNGSEIPLADALRAEPRLFVGTSTQYGVTRQIHDAISAFVSLYAGDVALGTNEVRRLA